MGRGSNRPPHSNSPTKLWHFCDKANTKSDNNTSKSAKIYFLSDGPILLLGEAAERNFDHPSHPPLS